MNLRFLRTFVAIADNAGFARAAARLNLTQSAASRVASFSSSNAISPARFTLRCALDEKRGSLTSGSTDHTHG